MYAVSEAFRTALNAGNPQRIFVVFSDSGTIMTNEHIAIDSGVTLHETWCDDVDITIGNTASSEINFVLFNEDGEWDDFEFGQFKAYIGVETSTTDSAVTVLTVSVDDANLQATVDVDEVEYSYELMPLGVFTGPRPNVVAKNEITVVSNDLMELFDEDMPSDSKLGISYPITAGALLRAMCTYLDVSATTYSFLNHSVSLEERPDSFDNSTMRDVLGWIAELACANALFNRNGQLELRWMQTTNKTYGANEYLDHSPYWYTTPPVNRIYVRQSDSDTQNKYPTSGSGKNCYLIQDNPFLGVTSS